MNIVNAIIIVHKASFGGLMWAINVFFTFLFCCFPFFSYFCNHDLKSL